MAEPETSTDDTMTNMPLEHSNQPFSRLEVPVGHEKQTYQQTYHDNGTTSKSLAHGNANDQLLKPSRGQKSNKVFRGLSLLTYSILLCLLTFLVTAAILGGALGSALNSARNSRSRCPSTSGTSPTSLVNGTLNTNGTISNYAAPLPSTILSLTIPQCPSQNGSSLSAIPINTTQTLSHSFTILCDHHILGGQSSLAVLTSTTAYSLEVCVQDCANMNAWWGWTICQAVSLGVDLSASWESEASNCFLFNGTMPSQEATAAEGWVSAVLVT